MQPFFVCLPFHSLCKFTKVNFVIFSVGMPCWKLLMHCLKQPLISFCQFHLLVLFILPESSVLDYLKTLINASLFKLEMVPPTILSCLPSSVLPDINQFF